MVQGTKFSVPGKQARLSGVELSIEHSTPALRAPSPALHQCNTVMCHSHENRKLSTRRVFWPGGSDAQLDNTSGAVCHLQPPAGYDVRSPKSQAAHIEFIKKRAALGRNPQDGSAAANAQGARFNIQLATCILNPVITRFRIQAYCIHRINRVMRQGLECM